MKRRDRPEPETPGPDRIRELIVEVVAAHARDERVSHHPDSAYFHPAAKTLSDLSPAVDYALARLLAGSRPVTSEEIDHLVRRLEQEDRHV